MTGRQLSEDPWQGLPDPELALGLRAEQGAQILEGRVLLQLPAHRFERAPRLPGRRCGRR